MVSNRRGAVITGVRFGKQLTIHFMPVLGEKSQFIQHGIGMIEPHTAIASSESHMPFAGMITAISQGLQIFGNEFREVGNVTRGHHIACRLLGIIAGEQATSRWTAARGGVALSEAQTLLGQ